MTTRACFRISLLPVATGLLGLAAWESAWQRMRAQDRSRAVGRLADAVAPAASVAGTERSDAQPMNSPPFGDSHWPVKKALSSDARKSAVWATSRGSPIRCSGVRATSAARTTGEMTSVMGVSM